MFPHRNINKDGTVHYTCIFKVSQLKTGVFQFLKIVFIIENSAGPGETPRAAACCGISSGPALFAKVSL